jgi:hypothetical protein
MIDAAHAHRQAGRVSSVSALASLALLRKESRTRPGPVPHSLGGTIIRPGKWLVHGDQYLLRTESGFTFHYQRGVGVNFEMPVNGDPAEVELWSNGSVYSAIAALNGLRPLHASAVAQAGRVIAFTGQTGVGKSTLAAGLGRHGLPLFCDDTLVLDLSGPGPAFCLPGHKRLKLTEQALALTGAERQERVAADVAKFYAAPLSGPVGEALPLGALIFPEDGPEVALMPLTGAEKIARLCDDHYTAALHVVGRGQDRAALFAEHARLANEIAMFRLVLPRDPAHFADNVRHVATLLCQQGSMAA